MRCMIMAAGMGTRLLPLTSTVAKPMVPIANRPALEHILLLLARHDIREAVVNLHHFPESIRQYFGDGSRWGVSVRYAYEPELMGTAGGVKNNQEFLEGDAFLVMSGDALTDIDLTELVSAHRRRGSIATLAVTEVDDPSEYGVVVVDEDQRVIGFQEKPAAADALSRLCNCGIYVFEPAIFERIPAGVFYDFGRQVLPGLVAEKIPFHVHRVSGYWSDVGNLREYLGGNHDALKGLVRLTFPGASIAEGVWSGAGTVIAEGADVVAPVLLGGDCLVEAGARLIGPVVLGDGCVVRAGAEISATVLWDGVDVGSGCRLVDALIASGVELERGVSAAGAVVGAGGVVGSDVDLAARTIDPGSRVD